MLAIRCRVASRTLFATRGISSTARRLSDEPPRPPRPIDDSTSALDYKTSHKVRPPPLPKTDLPRSRSAEEAVTNILYNTPPPSLQPYKKHVLNCLVQNEPGVLSRVSGILAGRGFNIDSLVVCRTEIRDLSRMCIVISGQDGVVEQARRQLEDLVPVWAVLDYTETRTISRELLLVKVSILGPEYLEDQLTGGPSHEPRASHRAHAEQTKLERETLLAIHFEESNRPHPTPSSSSSSSPAVEGGAKPLTPSEALRMRHQHLQSLHVLANQFGARIVDVSENSIILEMSGKTSRVEAFLSLVKPFGIIESARTGLMAMPRTPIAGLLEEEAANEGDVAVDASLLPPG
ncbi:small subunit of acetolactate synthase-domain-containing protein [Russula aff. rugulosa BPL654]|nr:small subunit of acetolactate synthase-domain-containing protein [Russula aff. rugulosa BPL654]